MHAIGFSKDKQETKAMAAVNRLDVGRPMEAPTVFTRFVKSTEGNSASHFNIFPMLQKLMASLGSLHANNHTETLVKAVSERFSLTTELRIIFTCFLVIPVGQR
jgi:hypothetical protein